MRNRFIVPIIVLAAAVTLFMAAKGEAETTPTLVDDLRSNDPKVRDSAVDELLNSRKAMIDQLLPLVDPDNSRQYSDDTRCAAAYLLGELRAVEAVPVLSKAMRDPPGRKMIESISRYDAPIFTALVKIGRPAVPAMIENLENSENVNIRHDSALVIGHILGGTKHLLELLDKLIKAEEQKAIPKSDVLDRLKSVRQWVADNCIETEEPLY